MSKLVERSIMQLLSSNNAEGREGKIFYGHFLNAMRKVYDHPSISTAAVNVTNKINLYINTEFFKEQTDNARRQILEHECLHIIHNHINRGKDLNVQDAKLFNVACDACINGPLDALHDFGITVDKLKEIIPDLEYNQTAEYYFKRLKKYREEKGHQGQENIEGVGDLVDDHDNWSHSDSSFGEDKLNEEIQKEIIKKALKDSIKKTEKSNGIVPMYIRKSYSELNKSTINWKQQLKQFFARVDKFTKKPTRKKLNRRYKHLNPGRKKTPQTHIAIGVDNSGSVNDALYHQFLSEIDVAARIEGIKFTIIQSDCEINSITEYTPKMKLERTGMGGTAYMPAIIKAIELKVDGMIYFGDGDIFEEKLIKPKFPFLWAMEEGRNAPAIWGKVCHIKYQKES